MNWTKLTPILLRQAQKMAIQKKKDIFTYLEEDITQNRNTYNSNFSQLKKTVEQKAMDIKLSDE